MNSFWAAGEIISLIILTSKGIYHFRQLKFKITHLLLLLSFFCVVILNAYYGSAESLKVILVVLYVFLVYNFPKFAIKVFILIYTSVIASNIFILGEFSKANQYDFIVIFTLFLISKDKLNLSKGVILSYFVLIVFELMQSFYFSSRSNLLFLFMLLFGLFSSNIVRSNTCRFLPYIPAVYIGVMYFYYVSAFTYNLPITLSNVERSSMIAWCIENFTNYIFIGPGDSIFIEGAKNMMFAGLSRDTPNDPHSVFLRLFVSLGAIVSSLIFALFFKITRKFRVIFKSPVLMVIYINMIIVLTLGTFTADTRVLIGLFTGVLMCYSNVLNEKDV